MILTAGGAEGRHAEVKADISQLRAEQKADVAEVKALIAEARAEQKADIAEVKTLIAEHEARVAQQLEGQTRWFVGFMLTGMGLMTAIGFGIAKLLQ